MHLKSTKTNRTDKGESVDVVHLGFQKAFGKVPHMRLLKQDENQIEGRY